MSSTIRCKKVDFSSFRVLEPHQSTALYRGISRKYCPVAVLVVTMTNYSPEARESSLYSDALKIQTNQEFARVMTSTQPGNSWPGVRGKTTLNLMKICLWEE